MDIFQKIEGGREEDGAEPSLAAGVLQNRVSAQRIQDWRNEFDRAAPRLKSKLYKNKTRSQKNNKSNGEDIKIPLYEIFNLGTIFPD